MGDKFNEKYESVQISKFLLSKNGKSHRKTEHDNLHPFHHPKIEIFHLQIQFYQIFCKIGELQLPGKGSLRKKEEGLPIEQ